MLCSGNCFILETYRSHVGPHLLNFSMSQTIPWNSACLPFSLPCPSPLPGPAWFPGSHSLFCHRNHWLHPAYWHLHFHQRSRFPTPRNRVIENIKASSWKNLFIVTIPLMLISCFLPFVFAFIPLFGTWNKGDCWICLLNPFPGCMCLFVGPLLFYSWTHLSSTH